jgi:hypothetical protein
MMQGQYELLVMRPHEHSLQDKVRREPHTEPDGERHLKGDANDFGKHGRCDQVDKRNVPLQAQNALPRGGGQASAGSIYGKAHRHGTAHGPHTSVTFLTVDDVPGPIQAQRR